MLPSPYRDFLFVRINAEALDRTESGLYIPDWQAGDKDAQQAEVVAVPQGLSPVRPLDYPGMDGNAYHYADIPHLPEVGDTVYLKPNTFRPEMEYPGMPGVFLVDVGQVVATKGVLGLLPFQGLLLCEEVWGDDVEVDESGVRERVVYEPSGVSYDADYQGADCNQRLVIELDPLPIPYTLRVLISGFPLIGQANDVRAGDVIVAHKMLFAYHAVKQKDDEEVSARWMEQPPKIVIDKVEYCLVPRQMVMAKQLSVPTVPATA